MDYQFQKPTQDEHDLFFHMEGEAAMHHGFVGYLRGDYGSSGQEFHTTWFDSQADLKTQAFKDEFDGIIDYLREASIDPVEVSDVFQFHCLQSMRRRMTDTAVRFKIVTEGYSYYFRCQPQVDDCHLYCMTFDNRFLLPEIEKLYAMPRKCFSIHPDTGERVLIWRIGNMEHFSSAETPDELRRSVDRDNARWGVTPAQEAALLKRAMERTSATMGIPRYDTGAEFWRDIAAKHGPDEALVVCGDYLEAQLRQDIYPEGSRFCKELFAAMFEASAGRTDPAKLIYPYPPQLANERGERSLYFEHRDRHNECARAIGAAINGSCYRVNFYNLNIAAMTVIQQYGFPRVNAVLAHVIRRADYDGRYSDANKRWAREILLPEKAFEYVYMNEHPVLIDGFADCVRELYDAVGAERFALPGKPGSGEVVEGYAITRAISFDDQRGFAIATHPTAGSVCWQFRTDRGGRDYYWGHYCENEQDAANNYIARVAVHLSDGAREEPQRAPAPAQQQPRKPKGREDR